jgi:GR25 family glycosyltransferase involved in LPS biosynthesis
MNNPLAGPPGNFRIFSSKNRTEDEKSLIDLRDKSMIFSNNPCQFPTKIYVINRAERGDRWETFQRINSDLFKKFKVGRWEATSTDHIIKLPVDAIFRSFLNCLDHSLQSQECVIVMEDDAYLAEGGIEKLEKAWKDLPEDWDVLIGNHYFFGQISILTENLAKPTQRASTINFSVFRKTALPKIKEYQYLREVYPSIRDFDHYVTSEIVPINNYTVWPMISREISSYSDHKGKILDSSIRIRENAYKYRFIDQEKYYSSLEGW